MYLHELDEMESVADVDVLAIDTGVNTQKVSMKTLGKKITEDATPTFASEDASTASAWINVSVLTSGEAMKSILNKISTMFKNIRFIYKMLGTTDISDIGGGTVTGALHKLNTEISPSGLIEESITYTYSGKSVTFYFRGNATTLSVLVTKSNESMTLPTSWTTIGTLTKFKPASDRYISLISSNGLTLTMRIWADGAVSIIAHSSNAYWLQSSGTVIYK